MTVLSKNYKMIKCKKEEKSLKIKWGDKQLNYDFKENHFLHFKMMNIEEMNVKSKIVLHIYRPFSIIIYLL